MAQARGNRRGSVFPLRLTESERKAIEALRDAVGGPIATGPWMLWRCLSLGNTPPAGCAIDGVIPDQAARAGNTRARSGRVIPGRVLPAQRRIILDLCGGSGSWSRPYASAGYRVINVTLPAHDVRTFKPPKRVHGILCAPPCTEFSVAKNGHPRDLVKGMACVNACMRIVLQCRPQWWALENPQGLLGRFLGTATDWFQPYQFGDPWTKRTCLWGEFTIPKRGPYVRPLGSHPHAGNPAKWAETPPGFARAFFEANP